MYDIIYPSDIMICIIWSLQFHRTYGCSIIINWLILIVDIVYDYVNQVGDYWNLLILMWTYIIYKLILLLMLKLIKGLYM